jgi:hypothetical protein
VKKPVDPQGLLRGRNADDVIRAGNAALGGTVEIKFRALRVKAPRAHVEDFVEEWRSMENAEKQFRLLGEWLDQNYLGLIQQTLSHAEAMELAQGAAKWFAYGVYKGTVQLAPRG